MSRFDDNRLFVLNDSHAPRLSPALARESGLNESILFLQLEFLIAVRGVLIDDRPWVRMSIRDMEQEFPFWSYSTINRAVQSLESRLLITVENFNSAKYDKTRWFSINLEQAANLHSIAVKQSPTTAGRVPQDAKERGVETRSNQNETGSTQSETRSTQNETPIDRESDPETKRENTRTPPRVEAVKQVEGVSVGSRFSFAERLAYAHNRPQVDNPEGFAMSKRACAGEFDEAIAKWLKEQAAPPGAKGEAQPEVRGCADCHGSGWWYPQGVERGAARCRHARLSSAPGLFDDDGGAAEARAGPPG